MASTVDLSEIQEFEDKPQVLRTKVESLTKMIQTAQHFICFTGAGLSTAANIPDYRGPDGAWTRKAQGRAPPRGTSFGAAKPTFSHNLLAQWCQTGRLDHIVSQNVDGLHRRSGVAAENISELHGNSFLEKCWKCSASYLRDAPVRQRSNAKNGGRCRECSKRVPHFCHCTNNSCEKCGAALKDSIIHFKENLPEEDLECAFEHAELADLCVVVGSSCRVTPAADIPQRVGQRGKNLVIINKQATPLDSLAKLVIHADIDTVFAMVEEELHAQSAHAQRTATSAAADPTPGATAMDPVTVVPGRAVSSGFGEPGVADVHEQIPVQVEAEDWGLALGNTHSEEQTGSGEATHKWTLYLSAVGAGAPALDGTVERCEFHLHPTFQPSSVTVSKAPFSITRKGWGTFTVFADVYFSASSGLAPVRLEHSLDFSGSEALGSVEVVHRAAPTLLSE